MDATPSNSFSSPSPPAASLPAAVSSSSSGRAAASPPTVKVLEGLWGQFAENASKIRENEARLESASSGRSITQFGRKSSTSAPPGRTSSTGETANTLAAKKISSEEKKSVKSKVRELHATEKTIKTKIDATVKQIQQEITATFNDPSNKENPSDPYSFQRQITSVYTVNEQTQQDRVSVDGTEISHQTLIDLRRENVYIVNGKKVKVDAGQSKDIAITKALTAQLGKDNAEKVLRVTNQQTQISMIPSNPIGVLAQPSNPQLYEALKSQGLRPADAKEPPIFSVSQDKRSGNITVTITTKINIGPRDNPEVSFLQMTATVTIQNAQNLPDSKATIKYT